MNKNFNIQLFAENLNTTATMSKEMKTFYEKRLIDQAEPRLVHDQFADHFVLAVHDLAVVVGRIRCEYAVFVAVLRIVVYLRAVKQRFGRNTPLVEADTAQLALLEQHDVQPFRSGTFRSHVSARAAADNCQIYHFCRFKSVNGVRGGVVRTSAPPCI